MKTTISEMKSTLDRMNGKLTHFGENISKLDILIGITENEMEGKKQQ